MLLASLYFENKIIKYYTKNIQYLIRKINCYITTFKI